jgi:hypothetical protein
MDGVSFAHTVRPPQGELTSPAMRWMEWANSTMANGYCEGMAIVSSLKYNGELLTV